MLDLEGKTKPETDHEKRVVLEDIPSDDTMISSLAICEKEQMAVSSYFVDLDEDINASYGFDDEHQLYQALNMRNECGQFGMNIGATRILDPPYLDDDDDDSQDSSDDDDTSQDNSQMMILTQLNWMVTQMLYFFKTSWLQLLKLGKPEELTLNIFPKIWRISHEDAQRDI